MNIVKLLGENKVVNLYCSPVVEILEWIVKLVRSWTMPNFGGHDEPVDEK